MAGGGWLGIDYGERRVGVAVATAEEPAPLPLVTLANDERLLDQLRELCREHSVTTIVLGLPRGLDGQETRQTQIVRAFAERLKAELGVDELVLQDEAMTSEVASERLLERGRSTADGAVDREAAAIILSDYLENRS